MADLSIIIVSYKGWERLTQCLESLSRFSGKGFNTEVIVVDNRSEDDNINKIEEQFSQFRFIHNTINGGFANGCNLGAKNAMGEYLLFLNPDTIATESEIEKLLLTAKQNPSFTIISCRQVNKNGKESVASGPFPGLFNITGFQRAIFKIPTPDALPIAIGSPTPDFSFPDWISGSVVLIRKERFIELKGFDEDFWMYFEDVDLCRRIRNNGGEIAFCRNITIEHNHGGSSRINLKTASLTKTEVHISRHTYISKHKAGFEKVLIQTFLIINNIISGGLMALPGVLLFFVPKVFARTLIFVRLISYYILAVSRQTWISRRSVNFKKF